MARASADNPRQIAAAARAASYKAEQVRLKQLAAERRAAAAARAEASDDASRTRRPWLT
ncbi:hypothetical protein Q5424_15130 [Conexibacter sp. JD483]|uniref:hypothetical protein n=1 Tax=unclassified Conexibacter TaxID=2627773 RepID=UPI002722C871|nr:MULTISPECIES: hypothetical protein [unclassified Conexibacter]MDO8188139.1 hypothetical protein [Conexibacter sp. CPCC 205706]MDO8201297.1 hypothetical protein [Conexibacter sp. CPCC 205762]MDR9370431.1 hypothetical protein [Conexibacter sp. JD483]